MKKISVIICMLVATFFIFSNVVSAGMGQGISEFGVSASLSSITTKSDDDGNDSKDKENLLMANVNYGYFLTDNIQLGGNLLMIQAQDKPEEGDKTEMGVSGVDIFTKFHLYSKGQTVVPYLGVQGGYIHLSVDSEGESASDNTFSYGGMGGAKFFVSENTSLNLELNYRQYKSTLTFGDEESKNTTDDLALLLGFSVYFGGK